MLTWEGIDGTTVPLDGSTGITALEQIEGVFELPIDLVIAPRVGGDGGALLSSRRSPRSIVLPLLIVSPTAVSVTWGPLLASFVVGGSLIYDGPSGRRTLRDVHLEAPARSMTGYDLGSRVDDAISVSLIALDPWWYGAPVLEQFDLDGLTSTAWNAAGVAWNAPIPWNGGTSTTVTVEGDVAAMPRFVVVGEVDSVTVNNGRVAWELVRPIPAGSTFELDTRHGTAGPHLGSNLLPDQTVQMLDWSLISERSRLFTLPVGSSSLTVAASGASAPATLLVVWESRWLTP